MDNTSDKLTCPECGKGFKNKAGLGGHRQAKHGYQVPRRPGRPPLLRQLVRDLGQVCLDLLARVEALEGRRGGQAASTASVSQSQLLPQCPQCGVQMPWRLLRKHACTSNELSGRLER